MPSVGCHYCSKFYKPVDTIFFPEAQIGSELVSCMCKWWESFERFYWPTWQFWSQHHKVHWGVNHPLKNTTPSFLPGSPLKSANCPSQPLFRQSPLYFGFSWTPLPPHLKTGFFRFLVNPHDIKTFLLLNISDFSFFYRKSHPLFPINLPLKIEILQRPPFLKILLESESPPQQIKKGGTL